MFVQLYSFAKAGWSRLNDLIMGGAPRRQVPQFPAPETAAEYLMARAQYTGNPLGGAADFYTHPERFQWGLENRDFTGLRVDCDSYAAWSVAALRQIPDCQPTLVTLVDGSGRFGHHVICVYKWRTRYGAIDTSGHRTLPDLSEATLCRVWSELYAPLGYRYVSATPTPYPF